MLRDTLCKSLGPSFPPPNAMFLSSQTLTSSPGFLRVFQCFFIGHWVFVFLTFLSPYLVSDHFKKKLLFLIYLSKALKTDL